MENIIEEILILIKKRIKNKEPMIENLIKIL